MTITSAENLVPAISLPSPISSVSSAVNFFSSSNLDTDFVVPSNPATGYNESVLSFLSDKATRTKAFYQNRMLGDTVSASLPTYNRAAPYNVGLLNEMSSKLSIASQLEQSASMLFMMSGVSNMVPSSTRQMLLNLMSSTQSNMFKGVAFARGLTPPMIASSIENDLTLNFDNHTISFSQINEMYNYLQKQNKLKSISNPSISTLSNLGIQAFLPTPLLNVFNTAEFVNTVNSVTNNDAVLVSQLTGSLQTNASSFNALTLSQAAPTITFSESHITLDDPLGVSAQQQLQRTLNVNYVASMVTTLSAYSPTISDTNINTIMTLLATDANNNFTSAFNGNVGVPPLEDVTKGVINESSNLVIESMSQGFQKFGNTLLSTLGIVHPAQVLQTYSPTSKYTATSTIVGNTSNTINPFDHLLNVKRNIEAKLSMNQTSGKWQDIVAIDDYLKKVLVSGNTNVQSLTELNDHINTVLNITGA